MTYLAYLVAIGADVAGTELVARTGQIVADLDLIVFVPIEQPDRVGDRGELRRLRRFVDRVLREMWMEDAWGWNVPALEVSGTAPERAQQVLARLGGAVRIKQR